MIFPVVLITINMLLKLTIDPPCIEFAEVGDSILNSYDRNHGQIRTYLTSLRSKSLLSIYSHFVQILLLSMESTAYR